MKQLSNSGRLFLCLLAYVVVGTVLYAPVLGSFFLCDDFNQIEAVQRGGPFGLWVFHVAFLRPLSGLSLYVDSLLWNLNATGYHITSFVLHLISSSLVFLLARLLLEESPLFSRSANTLSTNTLSASASLENLEKPTQKDWDDSLLCAFVAGLLFLVWPSRGEAVVWISGRVDVLAAPFALATVIFHGYWLRTRRKTLLALALICFTLGIFAKESVLSLPLLLLIFQQTIWKRTATTNVENRSAKDRSLWTYAAVIVLYFGVRRLLLGAFVGGIHWSYLPKSVLSFLTTAYLPALQSLLWLGVASILAVAAFGFYIYRQRPFTNEVKVLLLAFAASYLPPFSVAMVIGAIHADGQNQRFVYLPSAFACIALAVVMIHLTRYRVLNRVAVAVLVVVLIAQTWAINNRWLRVANTTQKIVRSVGPLLPVRDLVVLTVPDTLEGVYVFRNGLDSAIRMFYPNRVRHVELVSIVRYWKSSDVQKVKQNENAFALPVPNPTFYRTPPGTCGLFDFKPSGLHHDAHLDAGCTLSIQTRDIASQDRVVVYSAGQFVPLSLNAQP